MCLIWVILVVCAITPNVVLTSNIKAVFTPNPGTHYPRLVSKDSLPSMSEVTICHWINLHVEKPKAMTIVSYFHNQAADELLTGIRYNNSNPFLVMSVRNQYSNVDIYGNELGIPFRLGEWNHVCMVWSSGKGRVEFYLEGKPVVSHQEGSLGVRKVKNVQARQEIRSGGVLTIGQKNHEMYNKNFDSQESWEGFIADVQIWDEKITDEQIRDLADCKSKLEGNVFAWMKTPMNAVDWVGLSSANYCRKKDRD